MTQKVCLVIILAISVFSFGCAERYIQSQGLHAANYSFLAKHRKYIVWSKHYPGHVHESTVNASITQYLQANHQTIVERSQLEAVFKEQRLRLLHTADEEADLLRVGKLLGADQIIFADSTDSIVFAGYVASVTVRAVDVESAAILWTGSARVTDAVRSVGEILGVMPAIAMERALCPIEAGFRWKEYGEGGAGGCAKE